MVKKAIKVEGKEIQNPLEIINILSSAMGKELLCNKCGKEQKIILSSLQGDLDNLKQVNICQFCCTLQQLGQFIGEKQVEKMREKWEAKLKRLKLDPLSIAKYFYENWEISDPVIMQRLIYFAHLEILKEKDILLFEEKFQAWPGGPVLESVIYSIYKNHSKLKSFFVEITTIKDSLVLNYLEITAQKYSRLKSSQIFREARNKLWKETYDDLDNEEENKPINETNLFMFIQASKGQLFPSLQ
ncbi:MAG: DUF4065 domain-containing protein [Candidatus Moeniiplasma glomeromycotorum]|nr:DUF4065 domain-containing protein [Candidatus Moeniiplasma glomeromycotorum]MCE8168059.1 DUF4065 domain-containing protein [Candidatus Moeniiplasma glomeromycotorum]MCE8169576.1 DUF4065 domain-containing protein [Candidatus Moeniiplasma glomeromycotorum]